VGKGVFLPTASSCLGWWAAKTRREPYIKVQIVPVYSIVTDSICGSIWVKNGQIFDRFNPSLQPCPKRFFPFDFFKEGKSGFAGCKPRENKIPDFIPDRFTSLLCIKNLSKSVLCSFPSV